MLLCLCLQIYIHRVLKEIHPDISLSQKAISVLDSFTKDMHDRIANEAGDLCRRHNKATLSSREVCCPPASPPPWLIAAHGQAVAQARRPNSGRSGAQQFCHA